MSRIRNIAIEDVFPDAFKEVNVQYPLPTNGDRIYVKDINVPDSDNGGFSGVITDYFDDLKTVNNDASVTNPKIIKIWFNATHQVSSLGFGCDDGTKSFSNIVVKLFGSDEVIRSVADLSSDDTKYNSLAIDIHPSKTNGIIVEFHTADEIGLSNIIIFKSVNVNARLAAVSSLTNSVEDIESFRGALNVNQALVHREGINEYFKRDLGGATTLAAPVTAGDVDIDVASVVGFAISDYIRLSSSTSIQRGHFQILNIVGTVITLNRPIDTDMDIGDDVTEIDISLSNLGTQVAPISSKIQPPPYERWQITRLLITMLDATAMDDGKFGGATALPNGFVIRTVRNGVMTTNTYWNSNQDLKDDMFNVEYASKAPAGQYGLSGRWSLTESEFVADIDGSTGDYLEILNQDDLTVLIDFKIKAQGRLFGG